MPSNFDVDRQHALDFLLGRIDFERSSAAGAEFRLDRVRELLARLGNPHERLKAIHVAGTKGKGSTSAMIAAMLTAAGFKTGLYSSPHLEQVEERLAIDGQSCDSAVFVGLIERVRPLIVELDRACLQSEPPLQQLTYFEIITAIAFLHFAEQGVAFAVLEVGLGGRLDATNVCQPVVCVITSISFDHTKQLGNTLSAIAAEKAGIIKPGVPVISGVVADEPREVIRNIAAERSALLREVERDFRVTYHPVADLAAADGDATFDYVDPGSVTLSRLDQVELSLIGEHQAVNAVLALAVAGELRSQGHLLPDAALRRGLKTVAWPARIEVLQRRPAVVLDAAHNVASIAALVRSLEQSFPATERLLIFATTQDKDTVGMLERVLPHFDTVIFTRYLNNPRGVPAEQLLQLSRRIKPGNYLLAATPSEAWRSALDRLTPEHLLVVTGSFFIAAEMRAQFRAAPPTPV